VTDSPGPTRIAFLGPLGTFAHACLRALPVAAGATLLPLDTVTLAIDALRAGSADCAFVPIENSIEGAVPATLDELAGGEALVIDDEAYLPVVFDLAAAPGSRLGAVRSVATHPHAEAQVRRWLINNVPEARVTLVGSTAGAAQAVAAGEYDAAVCPPFAGELYGLASLAHDIADTRGAVTRFVLLTHPKAPRPPTGNDRTTLVAYLQEDHSGALLELLSEFSTRAVNLTRIESRPTKGRIGQYCFSIDCEGHIAEERVGDALAALHRICADVRYLGSYARRDGTQGKIPPGRADSDFRESRTWLSAVLRFGTS
jgi:prephenate dehydratase